MSTPTSSADRKRVFCHIGLPKTGTSYLQSILWTNRPRLREAGLLVPGRERRDHLWASLVVRDDGSVTRRNPRAPQAWDVVRGEIRESDTDALISHEFFCAASAEQARRMVDALTEDGAEVHVVVTAREPLGLFTSSWQEHLKNKGTTPLSEYATTVSDDPTVVWNWRALDLSLVLERWGPAVDEPARVHVITPPGPGEGRDELWRRLCSVLDVDAGVAPTDSFPNTSMGVVEAEALRRINARLRGFDRAFDRGVWIRSYLADDRLVPRGGEPYWPDDVQVAECRERGERAVALLAERGYDVVGDADSLRVPAELPERRHPDSVTDAEVAEVAMDLVAGLLGDVRELRSERSREPERPSPPPASGLRRRLGDWLRARG